MFQKYLIQNHLRKDLGIFYRGSCLGHVPYFTPLLKKCAVFLGGEGGCDLKCEEWKSGILLTYWFMSVRPFLRSKRKPTVHVRRVSEGTKPHYCSLNIAHDFNSRFLHQPLLWLSSQVLVIWANVHRDEVGRTVGPSAAAVWEWKNREREREREGRGGKWGKPEGWSIRLQCTFRPDAMSPKQRKSSLPHWLDSPDRGRSL